MSNSLTLFVNITLYFLLILVFLAALYGVMYTLLWLPVHIYVVIRNLVNKYKDAT